MARTSRQSSPIKQNYLAATSLRPNHASRNLSLPEQIMEMKLRSEQAKLVMLEAEVPNEDVKYMRYEDMPPPSPQQEAAFETEFQNLLAGLFDDAQDGPETGQTVQDWLRGMGAVIPDLPEWEPPLYLEKF